jgi:hypothetical protein
MTFERKEILKLTEWEVANLHLPPVTTVTLYEGSAPVQFLRRRIASMLKKNPWLTSRIVKRNTTDGVVAMAFSNSFETKRVIDQHFSVYKYGEVGFSLDKSYEQLVRSLLPVQCARSKSATDKDEVLFKVAIVPIEAGAEESDQSMPLQHTIALPGFALVVSMNHTLGDGYTYYKLYSMLSADLDVDELNPVRVSNFETAKTDIIGKKETAMFKSLGLSFGILGTYLATKFDRRTPQNICINEVDPAWVAKEKTKQEGPVPFVSTNDALSSWFFRKMKSDTNIMVANFRGRQPSVLNLSDSDMGNDEANVPYFPGDVETPALIRQSIRDANGAFRAKRAGSPETEIPSFRKLLRNKSSIISNWANFYCDVNLENTIQDNNESTIKPKLHLPIMEHDGIITSVWNNAIIFRPRADELGMLMITRHFDSDTLAKEKEQDGPDAPMGERIV